MQVLSLRTPAGSRLMAARNVTRHVRLVKRARGPKWYA